jgi:hypothetical protein
MTPPPFHTTIFIKQPTPLKKKARNQEDTHATNKNLKKGEPNIIARTFLQREQQKDHYQNFNTLWK